MLDITQLWERLNPVQQPANILDILIVALLFWLLIDVIRGTRAVQLLRGVIVLVIAALLAGSFLPLPTLKWLIETALRPALFVSIPVLFQPELRRALESLGRTGGRLTRKPFALAPSEQAVLTILVRAAQQLSDNRTGALMVIERETGLQEYADRGVVLDSRLSVLLLLNIFFPNAPLHDMAVIIRNGRILAANVVLPLSENILGSSRYGTRHRAALGISEQSDAVALVVSEETGSISVATNGRMVRHLNEERLRRLLSELLNVPIEAQAA